MIVAALLLIAVFGRGYHDSYAPSGIDWVGTDFRQRSDLQNPRRKDHLAELRERARLHIEAEVSLFSAAELSEIEQRYRSAFRDDLLLFLRPDGMTILQELVEKHPESNRAGCAILQLARNSSGSTRDDYLRLAIADHSDAWFESGAQVGATARAMLAVHLAALDRCDEAERFAAEVAQTFPGAIDYSGTTLDGILDGIKLLRTHK